MWGRAAMPWEWLSVSPCWFPAKRDELSEHNNNKMLKKRVGEKGSKKCLIKAAKLMEVCLRQSQSQQQNNPFQEKQTTKPWKFICWWHPHCLDQPEFVQQHVVRSIHHIQVHELFPPDLNQNPSENHIYLPIKTPSQPLILNPSSPWEAEEQYVNLKTRLWTAWQKGGKGKGKGKMKGGVRGRQVAGGR